MKPKNVIVWILLLGIVVLLMSTSVQAKELIEVNANDILDQIEKGEDVYLENVRITGELNLSKIELKTIPIARSGWEISYYDLEEELKIVESKIEIHDSDVRDDVDFSNTQFRKEFDFSRTTFLDEQHFRGADFSGDANFRDAFFGNDADFMRADFSGDADFEGAIFGGDADFEGAIFGGDANFRDAFFGNDADFMRADFSGDANFRDAFFDNDADFMRADFSGDANFREAYFGWSVTFLDADLNQIYVGWSSIKDVLAFDGQTYIKIIKYLRETEQFEEADAATYQYRRLSQANKELSWSWLKDVLAWVFCGYGVKPEYPLIWAFGLIMVFTLVYWRGKGIKRLKGNNGDNNRVSRWAAFYNSFYFSVVTFTTVGYGDWYPEDRYRIVVMFEGVLGWLLLALFIVTLANVMIRP